ncbi:hypothetical protein [Persephonella sp.]
MFRFLISFLTSFGIFYFLFSRKIIDVEIQKDDDQDFLKENTGKLINVIREFNRMKNDI